MLQCIPADGANIERCLANKGNPPTNAPIPNNSTGFKVLAKFRGFGFAVCQMIRPIDPSPYTNVVFSGLAAGLASNLKIVLKEKYEPYRDQYRILRLFSGNKMQSAALHLG